MSHNVKVGGRMIPIAVNGSVALGGNHIMGFLAVVSGTLSVVVRDGDNGASITAVTVVDAVPVTAGSYTPIPGQAPATPGGITVTLADGAKGTLFV